MASASLSLSSGALCSLLLCMLMLSPVLMTEHRMLVGGWRDRSVSDPDVRSAVSFVVDHYNKGSNSPFYSRALEITKAQSQVVEGVKYCLKILMVNTKCDKRIRRGLGQTDLEQCNLPPRSEQQRELCKCYVWSRPWLNDTRVTSMNCGQAN